MRIRVLSDLHLEFLDWTPPKVDCDVVVLAGDIHVGAKALPWIEKHFQGQTVIYIQGNHEGYGHDLIEVTANLQHWAEKAEGVDLRYLHNEWTPVSVGTETVWFFGGTLWTDFALDGNPELAKRIARQRMNDYRMIRLRGERLTPEDTVEMHEEALRQIGAGLAGSTDNRVIVTHQLPSRNSIDPDYRSSEVNPAYASDLEHFMLNNVTAPALWIHGHTHRSKDYVCGNTRVVCNPRGYAPFDLNPSFLGDLVVEV